jgi:PPM family protein phosphatase
MTVETWCGSDIGLTRKSNQDSVGSFPELNLFVVADGMGGHANGEVASRMAVEAIHGFFNDASVRPVCPSDVECMKLAVEIANQRIYEEGQRSTEEPPGRTLGTTVVVLKLDQVGSRASWVHVGDSRLYRVRGGRLELLTADHTLFGQEYWGKDAIPTNLPHTNRLVQALGTSEDVEVTTASDVVRSGDLFLLCSDGISGQLDPSVIERELTGAKHLESSGQTLIRLARDAGGRDNASAVLVRVRDE